MPQVAPFFVSKSQVVHFFVVTWPPNLSSSDIFKEIAGPDSDEKVAPNIIDKYTTYERYLDANSSMRNLPEEHIKVQYALERAVYLSLVDMFGFDVIEEFI